MARIHTRVKRALRLNTSKRHVFRNIIGKPGAKTFTTKEKAEEYAKNVLKFDKYEILPAKRDKKFKVVKS